MRTPICREKASLINEKLSSKLGLLSAFKGCRFKADKIFPDTFTRLTQDKASEHNMPTWNQKRRTMRRYNQSAHVYDTQYSEEQQAKITTIKQNLSLKNNSTVLDIGCGSGLLIKHFADKTQLYIGVEISRELLKHAKAKAYLFPNATLILADADNLPFPNEAFDAVFAVTLLQNMPAPRTTLAEIDRVSKTKASIIITGLRKRFTQEEFTSELQQANLEKVTLKLDEGNREYVCICHKMSVKSKFSPESEYPPH